MTTTDAAAEARETVYVAIELSKKTWVLGIAHPDRDRPSIHRVSGGNIAELVSRLRVAARNNRRILVCYEAGYDGFWLARALAKMGIECRVLDPASIQVNRRARRVKTDRIDVLALLRALIATDRGERHVCAIVRVPSVEEEDARRSHRERQRLVRERTGHINRIKGLLFAQGIRDIKPKLRRTRIDFAALETAEGHPLPDRLRRELEREYARLSLIATQLREVEKERDTADAQDPVVEQRDNCSSRCTEWAPPARQSLLARCSPDPSPADGNWDRISVLHRAPMTADRRRGAREYPRPATAGLGAF